MMNKVIKIHDQDYLQFDLLRVKQKDHSFFVGKVSAELLLKIYTVRPAIYDVEKNSSIAKTFPDEQEYYSHLVDQSSHQLSDKDFQRKYSPQRVSEINSFLKNEEYAFFPNTIIANCDLINDLESVDIDESTTLEDIQNLKNIPLQLGIYLPKEGHEKLLIPIRAGALLIIDGQHRLEGLKETDERIQKNYEVLLSFIIGYDRSVIAKQFYTINYEQKPVNKSLLYHLMGEFSTELDEATFLHKTIKVLNEYDDSPFYKRIKMLGTAPRTVDSEQRKKMSISLAFLIDALTKSVSHKKTTGLYQPIFRYYFENEEYQIEIIKYLMKVFNSISLKVENWDSPDKSLISKGMGVGAILKVVHLIFIKEFIEKWNLNPDEIKSQTQAQINQLFVGIEKVDFSKDGPFGRSASAGSVNKIKEAIINELDYFSTYDNYQSVVFEYKSDYGLISKFRKWLEKNTN